MMMNDDILKMFQTRSIELFMAVPESNTFTRLFTEKDKAVFKEVAGGVLVKWGYEKDLNW